MSEGKQSKSFAWLNVTQFLGALNDNVFKLLVIFLLVALLGEGRRTEIVATASAVFVIPFLLFSHAAGVLADRVSKRTIIVAAKCLEALVMVMGCVAIAMASPIALYAVLFVMCTQSALFGPSKYGIIPELVGEARLSRANSLLVGLSYLAIIIGTFLPTFLLLKVLDGNFLKLGLFCVGVSAMGIAASLAIGKTPAAGGDKRFSPLFLLDIFRTLRGLRADKALFLTVLGSSYFLFLGAFIQQNVLLYGMDYLHMGSIKESGYLFPVAAFGIAAGAALAGWLSGRNIEFGVVPLGAIGLTACCLLLGVIPASVRIAVAVIFFVGLSSGLFIVPLNAFIQYRSPPDRRGEILACANFLSFLGVALSAGTLVLLTKGLGLSAAECFVVIGFLTGVLAVVAIAILPDFLVRFVVVVITRCVYRIRCAGLEHLPVRGPALLVSNHVTWVDALLLSAVHQRRLRFVMARDIFETRWLKPIFKLMGVIPVSPQDPPRRIVASLKEARAAMDDGYMVCIFAEGALTRNGNLRAFRPGLERIVRGSSYPIIPVYIGGGWGSVFSYHRGRLLGGLPTALPYPITLLFGSPMPATSSTAEVRQAVQELSVAAFDLEKRPGRSLLALFIRTARSCWFKTAVSDTTGKRLSFGATLTGATALSRRIEASVDGQDKVGILLPGCVAGVLANLAVCLQGKVPVNLNFTASRSALESAIQQCDIKTVLSSRAFLEKLPGLTAPEGTVFLEDLAAGIGALDKLKALLSAALLPARMLVRGRMPGPDDLATIIFSSGSTGEPKGVMLSHHNIISNIESFLMVFKFQRTDQLCAVLPFFHSFGFTVTLWCPLLKGFAAVYHPNPLDGGAIAEVVREQRLTVLLATPTFLLSYMRRAKREDFASLRAVLVGAEKLKDRVADAFEKRFGVRPLEGYGATELSPVAALNVPDVEIGRVSQTGAKVGSVGHPLPGVAAKIVDSETGALLPVGQEGMLMVRGPNVMQGYLGREEQTAEVLQLGWYVTGDIARMDDEGFVFLLDRLSRYSKIGGEMVPHLAVEEQYLNALGAVGQVLTVTSAPDERKGEQLVVFYTPEAGDPASLGEAIAKSELPNLWKPRKDNYVAVEALPALGSGKLDLKRLRELARTFVEDRAGQPVTAVEPAGGEGV